MHRFQKHKFLTLSHALQHKKCAELVRAIYLESSKDLTYYCEVLEWMGLFEPFENSTQALSERYHFHLQKAGLCLREHNLLPNVRTNDRETADPIWPIGVYLDQLRSAHNVGSIIRTIEALSFGSLYLSEKTPTPQHKQVRDTAMGADKWINWEQRDFRDVPRPLIGLETSDEAADLYTFLFPPSFTLVLGNEEYGISNEVLHSCDYLVQIPLRGRKNSLNVANAFALAAGHIAYQRLRS